MSMPSAQAREPQARPRRVLISLYFVSLELTAALGVPFALGPTLSDGGVASCSGLLHVPVSHVLLFLVEKKQRRTSWLMLVACFLKEIV